MANENDTWIMHGVGWEDPTCLHSIEEAISYINTIGFLPLFKNEIPGFSLEERTLPENWWCEDPGKDPWIWREIIARGGEIAYGKFFERKSGFISKKWFPYFANVRRNGYDFDALWDDEKAPKKHKNIMDLFAQEKADEEYFSFELKKHAGYGKEGEKGFETAITTLQMQTYLCVHDFKRRKNKKGEEYGWAVSVYATPEHLWGKEIVDAAYWEEPSDSRERILEKIRENFEDVTEKELERMIGFGPEGAPDKKKADTWK